MRRWAHRGFANGAAVGLTALGAACAGALPPVSLPPPLPIGSSEGIESEEFEAPADEIASALLAPELRLGPHHEVAERVENDGLTRFYTLESPYGQFRARGYAMLETRLHELDAIATLKQMSSTKEFAEAAARALASPLVATWNLVRNPVASLTGLPRAAWESVQKTADLATSGGERSEFEDNAIRELIGFEKRKRKLAHRLRVDPYSSNPELQRELNRLAWAEFAGGLPGQFIPFQGEQNAEEAGPPEDRLAELLREYSPEDLRRINRIELAVMGVPDSLREEFLGHPWYSPRHETVLVEALAQMDPARDRNALVREALRARSEDDAFFYQRSVEMLRGYHRHAPLERVIAVQGALAGVGSDGVLVVALPVDHALWSPPTASLVRTLSIGSKAYGAKRVELWVGGSVSKRTRAELERARIGLTERAFERIDALAQVQH